MRYFLFVLLLLSIILSGCVRKSHWVWKNPNKTTELDFLKDKKECRDLAQSEVSQIDYYYDYSPFGPPFGFNFYAPYTYSRHGYHRSFFNDYRYYQEQDDLERFYRVCMKAKGWELLEVETKASDDTTKNTPAP